MEVHITDSGDYVVNNILLTCKFAHNIRTPAILTKVTKLSKHLIGARRFYFRNSVNFPPNLYIID